MGFEKGKSGNPAGRKPGTTNAATHAVGDRFAQLLDGYSLEEMRTDLKAIKDPKDRLHIIIGLAEFVTPKLNRTDLQASIKTAPSVFHIMPASQRPQHAGAGAGENKLLP
ncbi:MAG: hypothetical protein ACRYG7_07710 [Janthinobacterium lividum]